MVANDFEIFLGKLVLTNLKESKGFIKGELVSASNKFLQIKNLQGEIRAVAIDLIADIKEVQK
jgi:hypothetical protein